MFSHNSTHILIVTCDAQTGLVAAWTTCLSAAGGNILELNQYTDLENNKFFMRIAFISDTLPSSTGMETLAKCFNAQWHLYPAGVRQKVVILVSKFDHCLADLLYRWRIGELALTPVAIVSNHPRADTQATDIGSVPFYHLPITKSTKPEQEKKLQTIIENTGADLVILARYMQILSDEMSSWLSGKCINIHHSFLPGFKGARPYHQAHTRGVKLIGATAHYVTTDLDEGPIIEQDVERISHADTPEDLIRKGRDVERRVLSRAVNYHLQRRVILDGNRTVVFPD
ncbi:formyltetrahydrofolate deformylase [Acetobacter cibinongensis]|uniref:Formyltetrahydrofolate deformylase n=1 Tax=Acetobacter cibinongensis TaxID=146475 RepID=A0A1Z5YXD1_9PROT|nr:formyltetrahydrofolate deformylase [Acetobacter cibinongensis]OUJ03910.1 formyltetrahydrofolate deformylase [Acetobacter cibinongensis]